MSEELREILGVSEDQPNDWFEKLYAKSEKIGEGVPWANLAPHPILKKWFDAFTPVKHSPKALVVGCGLGDDALELEEKGYEVTAFDVSQTAIKQCKKRFPKSKVNFVTADLLQGIPNWYKKFDFVLEIFTIQALPPKYESKLIRNIADFVAERGELVLITEVQSEQRKFENGPPWKLSPSYVNEFEKQGLRLVSISVHNEKELDYETHLSIFKR